MSKKISDRELEDNTTTALVAAHGGLAGGFGSYLLGSKAHKLVNRGVLNRLQAAQSKSHLRTILKDMYGIRRSSKLPLRKALYDISDKIGRAGRRTSIAAGVVGGLATGAGAAMLTKKVLNGLSKESSLNTVEARVLESMRQHAGV